ncbi:phospholipase A-2-activating protein isoform X2 [Amborella trichopoda]|uniref:Phospholipase A-2-activating protein n=1 Tax=Amborella trichopoda TaxID=13333 RepID=U5D857_AMBTC|nr:phospholipase A-2-activating protein isoform X2 [Amborella trichopoda]ERN17592.1 hypothetical protein AMTR_s00059p00150840 [Amborella trichopoda]|eukprot:XP_006856125.1 phospholipase A-2-activating protein isoform X2 [Amborella trichopoda]
MEGQLPIYQLSCQLRGHDDDVRGLCICGDTGIASSSRDKTVRFWSLDDAHKNKYVIEKVMAGGHTSFVGPLAWLPPNEDFPRGRIVSAGMDTLVVSWDVKTAQVLHKMKGHQLQVTGLTIDDNGDILSSSIDCSIIRWRNGQLLESWEAHKEPVQTVIKLPTGELVTGSTDMAMKLWKGRTCLYTFVGHTDTVRSLAVMPDLGILSASHDGSVRLWSFSGDLLLEMVGHTSIVYSVAAHSSGLIASGSEDCFAKIWKDGVCIQSIEHPGCLWDVKFLENGDFVTACSDGVVRIWTKDKDKLCSPEDSNTYAAQLSLRRNQMKKVGGVKLADLPGVEALKNQGTRDGQTLIVREGDNGVAYSWNSRETKWDKIGEVVDGPEDNMGPKSLDGVQYDYVFDVDIGDGEPTRKLPYNQADNPYDVADKWLLKENLPLAYRQQIVDFILQNSGPRNTSLNGSFVDPYTGANAYVPGGPSNLSDIHKKPNFKHIPKRGMLLFDAANFDGILRKIDEFNNSLLADSVQKHLSLTELELSKLTSIVAVLKDTSRYHTTTFTDAELRLLVKLLALWPIPMLFPVIDLVKMIVLHPQGATLLMRYTEDGNDVLAETFRKATTSPAQLGNQLTSIRTVVNLFKSSGFHNWLQHHRDEILDLFSPCCNSSNKSLQLAYSTLLLNYTVLLNEKKDVDGQAQVLSAALEMAEDEKLDPDARFRVLVAIGSLMLEGHMKKIALDFDVENVAKAAKASKMAKIAEVGADIEFLSSIP